MTNNFTRRDIAAGFGAGFVALALGGAGAAKAAGATTILNVSYDPTREFYVAYNKLFAAEWAKTHPGDKLSVNQSHGGAAKQARAVIDGLKADVLTLAISYDIDEIAKRGLLAKNWQSRLPLKSTPYQSTIVFLVRKNNPWKIKSWGDLAKPGVQVITPNPKTSGGARYNYLAAWAWAANQTGGTQETAQAFVKKLYQNVPVLDSGARGSTTTFVQRRIGDVLLTWENEAHLAVKELGAGQVQIVYPTTSILAEPPVAVVDKIVDQRKTRAVAEAYLKFLYSEPAQNLVAQNYYRPTNAAVLAKYRSQFPDIPLFTVDKEFGGWQKAQKVHFSDGGIFDQITKK